jgi:hypothetical protein
VFHYTPKSASWLNTVRGFLRQADQAAAATGRVPIPVDHQAAINRFLAETNDHPKPFLWTADPDKIIAAVKCGYQTLDSITLMSSLPGSRRVNFVAPLEAMDFWRCRAGRRHSCRDDG